MEVIQQYSAYPESYSGIDGCISILKQNCISAEQTEFPFKFTINIVWDQADIEKAISEVINYVITFENSIFTIIKI